MLEYDNVTNSIVKLKQYNKEDKDQFVHDCEFGYFDKIHLQLNQNTTKQNKQLIAYNEYQAFRKACKYGHLDIAKCILSYVTDNNIQQIIFASNDDYAFRHACIGGHLEIVKWIYEMHPTVKMCGMNNFALHKTCEQTTQHHIIKWLLLYMTDTDVQLMF